jgi:hypothetical protein
MCQLRQRIIWTGGKGEKGMIQSSTSTCPREYVVTSFGVHQYSLGHVHSHHFLKPIIAFLWLYTSCKLRVTSTILFFHLPPDIESDINNSPYLPQASRSFCSPSNWLGSRE